MFNGLSEEPSYLHALLHATRNSLVDIDRHQVAPIDELSSEAKPHGPGVRIEVVEELSVERMRRKWGFASNDRVVDAVFEVVPEVHAALSSGVEVRRLNDD